MNRKIKESIPEILLVFLCLSLAVGTFFLLGEHNIDADSASEMVLADLLNQENGLLSTNWFYSTELRVISPVPVYQLCLRFISSWHVARTIANVILLCGMTALVILTGKSLGLGEASVYTGALILLPVSWAQRFLVSWYGFYTVYVMDTCLFLLLIARGRRKRLSVVLFLLGGISGLSGVRMPMLCGIPVLAASLLCLLFKDSGKKELRRVVYALASFAGMMVGYWINGHILAEKYVFQHYDAIRISTFSAEEFLKWISALLAFWGYQEGVPLMSLQGMCNLGIVAFILLLPVLFIHFLGKMETLKSEQRMACFYAAVCSASVMVLVCIGSDFAIKDTSVGYFLPGMYFACACCLKELQDKSGRRQGQAVLVGIIILFFMCSILSIRKDAVSSETPRERAAKWLCDNGYTQGYATYWNGNVLSYYADGKLDLTTFSWWGTPTPQKWLQKRDHMTPPKDRVFIYTDDKELGSMEDGLPFAKEEHLLYEEDGICLYVYDSGQEVIDLLAREGTF